MAVGNKEKRQARAWLGTRKISPKIITAKELAEIADELGLSFAASIKHLMSLMDGGQGEGALPETREALESAGK